MAKKRQVAVAEFEAHAAATDQLDPNDTETPLLGLVGEIGSLVSALKKKRRDTDDHAVNGQSVANYPAIIEGVALKLRAAQDWINDGNAQAMMNDALNDAERLAGLPLSPPCPCD